jgi:hypothetical protein
MHGKPDKCIQNFGWKSSWKELAWKMDLREAHCEDV